MNFDEFFDEYAGKDQLGIVGKPADFRWRKREPGLQQLKDTQNSEN